MSDVSLSLPVDRRGLLFRILGDADPGPLTPDDRGPVLMDRLLLPRVRNVYLEAAAPWPEDTEDLVHGVRVSSRRLVEALALVAPLLPRRPLRRVQRRAKTLRRDLGASREADVLVADFRRLATTAGLDEDTVHALDKMTEHGQDALRAAMASNPPEALLGQGVDVLELGARAEPETPLRTLASHHLYARVEAAAPLVGTLEHEDMWPEHHQLRIKCKHLRYTIEILGAPFSDLIESRTMIARLKDIQDALGVLNDAQDLLDWLERPLLRKTLGKKTAKTVRALAEEERARRYRRARERVGAEAPALFGDMRRIAGVMGPIGA